MKRVFCVFLLSLMVVGLLATPANYDITPEMIDHFGETLPDEILHYPNLEFPTRDYFPSADGDESSESITSFSETTPEDTLFFPDTLPNNTVQTIASTDDFDVGGGAYDYDPFSYAMTYGDSLWWRSKTNNGIGHLYINFTNPHGDELDGLDYALYSYGGLTITLWQMYDYVDAAWETIEDIDHGASHQWHNGSVLDHNYFDSIIMFRIYWTAPWDILFQILDYAEITSWDYMTLADSDHYAESFADVSDWGVSLNEAGESITTDGDVVTLAAEGDSSADRDNFYTNSPSLSSWQYVEICYKMNSTAGYSWTLYVQDADSTLTDQGRNSYVLTETTSWRTDTWYVDDYDGTWDSYDGKAENVIIQGRNNAGVDTECYVDYLRIGPSNEMGWQHDGSTTEAISHTSSGNVEFTESSDGDVLTMNATMTNAYSYTYRYYMAYDTTTTACDLNRDYYPLGELRYRVTQFVGLSALSFLTSMGGYYATIGLDTDGSWHTLRWNQKAAGTVAATKALTFFAAFDSVGDAFVVETDWAQYCSIANYTYTGSGVGIDDYLYVDSGVLYSNIDDGYIELNHDPALSVSDTYSIYNLTTPSTAPEFSQYVSEWSSYSDDTRGATTSGTVTDIKLKFDSTEVLSAIKFIEDSTAPNILDKFMNPTDPDDDESVTITVVTYDALEVWEVTINAVIYPVGFSDVDYEMTEQTADVLWSYEFSTLLAGYYLFAVTASDCANTYSEYIPVTVRESEITVNSISLFGASDDFDYMHWSFKINKDCTYVIREWSENVGASDTHSGSVAEGVRNIAWEKLPTDDTKVNFTVTFTNASLTYVFDSSYEVAQTVLSVTSYDWGLSETQVTLSYQTSKSGTYTLYLDDVQDSTSSFVAGSNFLNWSRPSAVDPTEIYAAMKLTDGTTTIWLNQTYSEFLLTAFSIQTLFMDLTDPTVSAIFTTSWANATGYLYENDVQMDTQAEGVPLSYTKATVAGTYNVALKMDAGGEVAWYNTTYSVSAEDALSIVALVFDTSGLNVSVYVSTNWANTTVTIYENNVQKTTGSEGALSYVKAIASGDYSVGIKIDGTADSTWANFTYTIDTEASLSITSLNFGIGGSDVTAFATTNWMNATLTLFENDVQKDTGNEGTTLSYTKATAAGDYNIGLKIDAGADLIWANYTYTVSAEDTLSITALSFDTSGLNVSVYVNTNWANTTVTLYENDVQQVTGSEGSLSYLKATSAGDYNVSVKIDGTADSLWANYTYNVAAETALIIHTLIFDKSGPNVTAFITTNWGNCTITIYQDNVQKDSDSEGITLSYARSTAAGTYNVAIKIDGGASTLWHNDSYTIALEYSWQYIYVFDTGDPATYFPWESFDFYVNGSLIEKNEFYGRTDQGYRIAVVDKFGDTIYNATHSFDYTYRLSIAIYSFKVKCWVDGEVNVTITSSAGGVMNTWMGWGDLEEFYLFGSKTYQVKWHLDDSDRKVKATGWHYYPAIDWDGNQANPDPNWYGPVSASYLTIDDYGIGHLVGVVEGVDDGGGGGDTNATLLAQAAIAAIAPIAIGSVIATAGIVGAIVWYFLPSRIPGVRDPPKPPTSNKPPKHKPAPSVGMASRKMQSRTGIKKKESRTK